MILWSDGEFALTEFGEGFDFNFGICISFWLRLVGFVMVMGRTVLICDTHVHVSGMFAGPGAIYCYSTSPALTIAGGRTILILQGFVLD